MTPQELARHVREATKSGKRTKAFSTGCWNYIKANVPAKWQWPVYILADIKYAETEEWLKECGQ